MRTEATGYGAVFFLDEMLHVRGASLDGMRCLVSGSGKVATYAIQKVHDRGGTVVGVLRLGDHVRGADIAGFHRVADAMVALGLV